VGGGCGHLPILKSECEGRKKEKGGDVPFRSFTKEGGIKIVIVKGEKHQTREGKRCLRRKKEERVRIILLGPKKMLGSPGKVREI